MVMGVMIVVSVFLQFLQEFRSSRTASQLKASEDVEQMDRLEVRA
jgi:magnesium-transporting ATPase (P-type)